MTNNKKAHSTTGAKSYWAKDIWRCEVAENSSAGRQFLTGQQMKSQAACPGDLFSTFTRNSPDNNTVALAAVSPVDVLPGSVNCISQILKLYFSKKFPDVFAQILSVGVFLCSSWSWLSLCDEKLKRGGVSLTTLGQILAFQAFSTPRIHSRRCRRRCCRDFINCPHASIHSLR